MTMKKVSLIVFIILTLLCSHFLTFYYGLARGHNFAHNELAVSGSVFKKMQDDILKNDVQSVNETLTSWNRFLVSNSLSRLKYKYKIPFYEKIETLFVSTFNAPNMDSLLASNILGYIESIDKKNSITNEEEYLLNKINDPNMLSLINSLKKTK